jgi:hypothetical protein
MDDLKKLFEEVKAKGDKTKRVVRSEKAAEEEAKKNAAIDAAMAEETKGEEEAFDPLEMAPEKDVLGQYGHEWMDATAAIKKWDEKVAKLTEVVEACKGVKIKPGNVEPLAAFLKKEVAQVNINIANAGIQVATAVATGMKQDFAPAVKILMTPIFTKFKEKRPIVLEEIRKFGDAALGCSNLEELGECYIPLITNVAPGVKNGVLKWLEKSAAVTYIDKLQNIQGELMPAMAKVIEDKDGTVRDSALHCLGILKGRLGQAVMDKHFKNLNAQKQAKIDEAAAEIKPSKYDRPEGYKPPAPKAAKKVEKVDDDAAMTFDAPTKPKRAPPKGLG